MPGIVLPFHFNKTPLKVKLKNRSSVMLLISCVCMGMLPACVHWGYNGGPTYKKITTDKIRYICSANEFRLKKAPATKASMYCYKGYELLYRRIVVNKDTLIQDGFLKLPNDLIALTKNTVIKAEIILDEKDYYDFIISRDSCINDSISGSFRVY